MAHKGKLYPVPFGSRYLCADTPRLDQMAPVEFSWAVSSWTGGASVGCPVSGRGLIYLEYESVGRQSWVGNITGYLGQPVYWQLMLSLGGPTASPFSEYTLQIWWNGNLVGQSNGPLDTTNIYRECSLSNARWTPGPRSDILLFHPNVIFLPVLWTDVPTPVWKGW